MFSNLENPPVGGGTYGQWIVFVLIIMFSVALATILVGKTIK